MQWLNLHLKPNVQTKKFKGKRKCLSRKIYDFKPCLCASCASDVLHMKVVKSMTKSCILKAISRRLNDY